MENIIVYLLIGIMVALILYLGVRQHLKSRSYRPDFESRARLVTLEFKDLEEALGGRANIEEVSSQGSKVEVTLKDTTCVDGQKLKDLGASGIVISKGVAKMIFGHASSEIATMFKNYLNQ